MVKLKHVKDLYFIGIEDEIIHTHQLGENLIIHATHPVLHFEDLLEEKYISWKLSWEETADGDDRLKVDEYESGDFRFIYSSYSLEQNQEIKNVSGYGFIEKEEEILHSIVLELEQKYIQINAGAAIEIKITNIRPVITGENIF